MAWCLVRIHFPQCLSMAQPYCWDFSSFSFLLECGKGSKRPSEAWEQLHLGVNKDSRHPSECSRIVYSSENRELRCPIGAWGWPHNWCFRSSSQVSKLFVWPEFINIVHPFYSIYSPWGSCLRSRLSEPIFVKTSEQSLLLIHVCVPANPFIMGLEEIQDFNEFYGKIF